MPQFKRLRSDVPYTPVLGINPDSNGLSLRPEECAYSKNLRFFQKDTTTRGGTSVLAFNSPSGDPILHVHNYKSPNGTEKLFGFTKDSVFIYNSTTKYWTPAWGTTLLEFDTSVTTGWTMEYSIIGSTYIPVIPLLRSTYPEGPLGGNYLQENMDALGLPPGRAFHSDTTIPGVFTSIKYVYTFDTPTSLSVYDNILVKLSASGGGLGMPNVGGYPITFEYRLELLDGTGFQIGLIGPLSYTFTSAEELALFFTGSSGSWKDLNFDLTGLADTAITTMKIGMEVHGYGINSYATGTLDGLFYIGSMYASTKMLSSDVSFWHTTDFIDKNQGATVVAAGSNQPAPGAEETDSSERVLYYYNTSTGYFTPLAQTSELPEGSEATSVMTPSTRATVVSALPLTWASTWDSLVPGSFFISTAQHGILARASSLEGTFGGAAGYALVPVNEAYVVGGSNSYVLKDGSAWSIEIEGTTATSNQQIFLGYDYAITAEFKPRFVWVLNNRILMANTYEDNFYQSWRVRWSYIGDMTKAIQSDYADLIDTDVTPITGGEYQAPGITIYKGGSIIKGRWVGSPITFQFETAFLSGTYAGKTVKPFNQRQYFLGYDDVYVWDGSTATSITMDPQKGSYRTRDKIFSILNHTRVHYCMANIYPKYQEYWLWVVRTGETYPSSVFVYNMVRSVWFYYEFSPTTCVGLYTKKLGTSGGGNLTFADLEGTYAEQNWSFEGGQLDGTTQSPILAALAGNVYVIDDTLVSDGSYTDSNGVFVSGTPIATELITRDFTLNDVSYQKRWNRLNFEATGSEVTVGYHPRHEMNADAFLGKVTVPLDSTNIERHYFPDLVNETIRFSFEATGSFSIRWMQPQGIELDYENE